MLLEAWVHVYRNCNQNQITGLTMKVMKVRQGFDSSGKNVETQITLNEDKNKLHAHWSSIKLNSLAQFT